MYALSNSPTDHISVTTWFLVRQPIKIFVIVIPKEGLTGTIQTKPSFGMTQTTEFYQNILGRLNLFFLVQSQPPTFQANQGQTGSDREKDPKKRLTQKV